MSAKSKNLNIDWSKSDAHVIQPEEYDELPELTDEFFDKADLYDGRKLLRKGRPVATDPRLQVTIRLPASVLERWKATGAGWQTRMAEALSKAAPQN